MNDSEFKRLKELLIDAADLPEDERQAYLDEACKDDPSLRRRIEAILAHDADPAEILKSHGVIPHSFGKGLVGQTIAHYRILDEVGVGGMGVVYQAEDIKLKRPVALKFLPSELTRDDSAKTRFLREAQAAAVLDHPSICAVHEIEEVEGLTFIVMAYIDGGTLKDRIASGPLDLEAALEVAVQTAEGLCEAHENGIVHRDIKPSNLMISSSGRVKITDFGLARTPDQSEITKTGTIMGTIAYMAPEQVRGAPADNRTDIWAFGVVLHEMLTGLRPFTGESDQSVLYSICHEDPPRLSAVNDEVTSEVEAIVAKCLRKLPEERYQTAAELCSDLKRVRYGEKPVYAKYPGHAKALISRKWRWPITVAALIVAVILATMRPSGGGLWSLIVPNAMRVGGIPSQMHLAVLPVSNIGNDPANQPLCDGLTEYVTSKLSQLEQFQGELWVVPASEVYASEIRSARDAHREFGVNLAVTGSLHREENEVQLNLNLVDTGSLRQLKSRVIDGQVGDVSFLQDDVIHGLAQMLQLELQPQMVTVLTAGASTVAEAQDLYLQARGYLARHEDKDNIDTSIALFGKALDADSAFALAYAGLGEAYWRRYLASRYTEDAHLAIDYCGRAIELNDALAPCRVTLGMTYNGTGRPADAVWEFKRALTLDPADVEAIIGLATSYERMGALDKAESTYVSAIALRPSYWAGYNELGGFYYDQGRYDDAIEQYNEVIALTPYNTTGYNNIGAMYCYLNRWPEARKAFEQSIEAKPNYVAYSNLGTVHFLRERFSEAAEMYEKALELGDGDYRVWGDLATSLHYVHGLDRAREAYQQAIQRGEEHRTINPRNAELLCHLAGYYLAVGEEQKAHEYVTEALKRAPEDLNVLFHAGHLFESSGDRERALQLLDKALELGYPKAHVEEAPWLRELREDPRFRELLQKHS